MPLIKLFKILIVVLFLLTLSSVVAAWMLIDTLPNILQNYLAEVDSEYYSSDFSTFDIIFGLIAISFFAVVIGLWKLKNWARHSYLIITIIFLPFYFVFGPIVMNPLEAIFSDLSFMIEGALIYMMYMTPLRNEFKLKANKFEETNS